MDQDQERDYAEEEYNRRFCIPCGTSPCTWDGQPDGFHTDDGPEPAALNWQPVVHRGPGKLCGHVQNTAQGWVSDCDDPADFAATDEEGLTHLACGRHVHDTGANHA